LSVVKEGWDPFDPIDWSPAAYNACHLQRKNSRRWLL